MEQKEYLSITALSLEWMEMQFCWMATTDTQLFSIRSLFGLETLRLLLGVTPTTTLMGQGEINLDSTTSCTTCFTNWGTSKSSLPATSKRSRAKTASEETSASTFQEQESTSTMDLEVPMK